VSVKLSKTEIEVGKLYFEQGKKPKEIAELLGLSINTVYKAISKYRSYIRELEKEREEKERKKEEPSSKDCSLVRAEDSNVEEKYMKETSSDAGNGKTIIVEDSLRNKVSRRATTMISFRAYLPVLPIGFISYEHRDRVLIPNTVRNDIDIVSKFVDCMLSIVRELENIRDVLLKISERIENIKIVSENNSSRTTMVDEDSVNKNTDEYNVPSFIRDNVWVDIIKSKYASID